MIYLSGAVQSAVMERPNTGVILTPMMGNRPNLAATHWAADTGCFAKPEAYSTEGYLTWLDSFTVYHHTCLFATAPDRWGNAAATLEVARPVLPLIRRRVPAAFCLQDGFADLPIPWSEFDCLFVGGSNAHKFSEATYELVAEAKARGKWVHQGRCNSKRRLVASALHGYDSADGTYLAFGPDINIPKLERWLRELEAQPPLIPPPTALVEGICRAHIEGEHTTMRQPTERERQAYNLYQRMYAFVMDGIAEEVARAPWRAGEIWRHYGPFFRGYGEAMMGLPTMTTNDLRNTKRQ